MTRSKIYGPYKISSKNTGGTKYKRIEKEHIKEFWAVSAHEMAAAKGCYIFCLKNAKGYQPYYVGQTYSNFKQKCFDKTNLQDHYNRVLSEKQGTPVMFFLKQKNGKPSKNQIEELETYLIVSAAKKNPLLSNKAKRKGARWSIDYHKGTKIFRTMMGI